MKHEFLCGGDYGAWECEVTVELTEKEENLLQEKHEEHLYWFPPLDGIYNKVIAELEQQCTEEINLNSLVIWVPSEFRKDI